MIILPLQLEPVKVLISLVSYAWRAGRERPAISRAHGTHQKSMAISGLIGQFPYSPFDNPLYLVRLATMFLNSLALDMRGQLRSWTSKRCDRPLATVRYIPSVVSFLGVWHPDRPSLARPRSQEIAKFLRGGTSHGYARRRTAYR